MMWFIGGAPCGDVLAVLDTMEARKRFQTQMQIGSHVDPAWLSARAFPGQEFYSHGRNMTRVHGGEPERIIAFLRSFDLDVEFVAAHPENPLHAVDESFNDFGIARRAPGRPRLYDEPQSRLTVELPASLVSQLDMARASEQTRRAFIEAAIREKLERN